MFTTETTRSVAARPQSLQEYLTGPSGTESNHINSFVQDAPLCFLVPPALDGVASTSHTACKSVQAYRDELDLVLVWLMVKDSSLDKSGTQQDSSDVPVTNIKDPGDHLTRGGFTSVLSQHAT